ncbi:hypothetical protein [Actinoplanes derwentensis]|uniref:Proteins of 100 residues with WXG n=1 Tax=Actinoplanes derwentensis TaxID=113562 RepID=A0A1H2BRB5_9ACTN|nr:hypothetical protein [Actinoplanes derwentensis]GID83019.1 hypothetical protein Ade03nite_19430 [Actinoplanes derwentensis]SDT60748.1 hypothetical protein SAMN04489716_4826 [Actinoplanes derwentensis]
MQDPTLALVPVEEPEDSVASGFPDPGVYFNYVSPTAWINAAIESLSGFDALGYCTDWVAGDWAAIYKFGDALGNLGRCVDQVAVNVQQGFLALDADWDGNANDAAARYFTSLSSAISELRFALTDLGKNYHKAANGAWGLSTQLGNLIQALVDKAIVAGVIAVGSSALMTTGAGLAGYAALALIVADMVNLASSISAIISTGMMTIFGSFGMGMDIAYQGGSLDRIPLPPAPYAGPGA